jgi:4-hydroxyphenylacetate 3-hydroxylase, reductase component
MNSKIRCSPLNSLEGRFRLQFGLRRQPSGQNERFSNEKHQREDQPNTNHRVHPPIGAIPEAIPQVEAIEHIETGQPHHRRRNPRLPSEPAPIAHTSRHSAAFKNAKHFAINILAVEQVDYSQRFASPAQDKLEGVDWRPGVLGSPILPNVLASLECALETTLQGGDHVILIGRVKKYSRYAGNALLYAQGRYAVAEDHPSLQLKSSGVVKADAKLNVSEMRLMTLLTRVQLYLSAVFDKYRQSQGLNITHTRILSVLSGGNQLSLEEIVARSFLPRDSAEDALDSLTERGHVAGQPKALALTKSGRNLFTRLLVQLDKFEVEQLSGISQQDIAVTRSALEKLYDRLRPS